MDEQMGVWLHSSGSILASEKEKQFLIFSLAQPNTVLKENQHDFVNILVRLQCFTSLSRKTGDGMKYC